MSDKADKPGFKERLALGRDQAAHSLGEELFLGAVVQGSPLGVAKGLLGVHDAFQKDNKRNSAAFVKALAYQHVTSLHATCMAQDPSGRLWAVKSAALQAAPTKTGRVSADAPPGASFEQRRPRRLWTYGGSVSAFVTGAAEAAQKLSAGERVSVNLAALRAPGPSEVTTGVKVGLAPLDAALVKARKTTAETFQERVMRKPSGEMAARAGLVAVSTAALGVALADPNLTDPLGPVLDHLSAFSDSAAHLATGWSERLVLAPLAKVATPLVPAVLAVTGNAPGFVASLAHQRAQSSYERSLEVFGRPDAVEDLFELAVIVVQEVVGRAASREVDEAALAGVRGDVSYREGLRDGSEEAIAYDQLDAFRQHFGRGERVDRLTVKAAEEYLGTLAVRSEAQRSTLRERLAEVFVSDRSVVEQISECDPGPSSHTASGAPTRGVTPTYTGSLDMSDNAMGIYATIIALKGSVEESIVHLQQVRSNLQAAVERAQSTGWNDEAAARSLQEVQGIIDNLEQTASMMTIVNFLDTRAEHYRAYLTN